jgi:voltage-gated potassium channel
MESSTPRFVTLGWRLFLFWSLPMLLIVGGSIGYRLTERWSWFDSFYVAVITLTSIGYGDKHAFSLPGRVLTLTLALVGISAVAVAATELVRVIITGELGQSWGKRRMKKRIAGLEHHVIVCGYGGVGRHVCEELLVQGIPVVAVDRLAEPLVAAREAGVHTVLGEATADTTLHQAGIGQARALIAVAGTDADNVLITMAARLLRPELPIISRAEEVTTVSKLLRAGATRAASPQAIAGGRIARAALHPSSVEGDLVVE